MVTQQFGGLGLGLAISRSLAEAHGGRLRAASLGKNQGATFLLELPEASICEPAQKDNGTSPAIEEPRKAAASLRILLVEDNADTLRVMSRLLVRKGHVVAKAGCIAEALRLANEQEFDLLISDLGLPDGSGLDLIRAIRESKASPIPGIALSGFGMDEDVRRSHEAGFLEHLIKPIDFSELEAAIGRVTEGQGRPANPAS